MCVVVGAEGRLGRRMLTYLVGSITSYDHIRSVASGWQFPCPIAPGRLLRARAAYSALPARSDLLGAGDLVVMMAGEGFPGVAPGDVIPILRAARGEGAGRAFLLSPVDPDEVGGEWSRTRDEVVAVGFDRVEALLYRRLFRGPLAGRAMKLLGRALVVSTWSGASGWFEYSSEDDFEAMASIY